MAITGSGFPPPVYDDVIHVQSTQESAAVNDAKTLKGKVNICASGSCVVVDAGENGITQQQKEAFSRAFRDFIIKNPGADLTASGAAVFIGARGGTKADVDFVRVASQFVGYNLPKGWNSEQVRTIIYVGSASQLQLPSSTAGKLDDRDWVKDRTPQTIYTLKLNMDWKDHRTNPSGLARTMIHEYLHRKDELGPAGGMRVTPEHLALDEKARGMLEDYGLSGGGCQSVGDSIIPGFAPSYPGCDVK